MIEVLLALLLSQPVHLTWTGHSTQLSTCESAKPRLNEYTGQYDLPFAITSEACYESSTREMSRDFASILEAQAFIAHAPKCGNALMSCAEGFAITTNYLIGDKTSVGDPEDIPITGAIDFGQIDLNIHRDAPRTIGVHK